MEETSINAINKNFAPGPASSPFVTAQTDRDKEDGAMDILDAEIPRGDDYASEQSSKSDDEPDEDAGLNATDCDEDEDGEDKAAHDGQEVLPGASIESGGDG